MKFTSRILEGLRAKKSSAERRKEIGCGQSRSVAPIAFTFEPRQEKGKGLRSAESAAEIAMATKVPDLVDKHVGSRVRMRRLMLDFGSFSARAAAEKPFKSTTLARTASCAGVQIRFKVAPISWWSAPIVSPKRHAGQALGG